YPLSCIDIPPSALLTLSLHDALPISDVLKFEAHDPGRPSRGEVLVEHRAIGLNFIDVYFRTGLYKAETPFVPGGEAAGVVLETGDRKSTRLNSSHVKTSYAVFCWQKK